MTVHANPLLPVSEPAYALELILVHGGDVLDNVPDPIAFAGMLHPPKLCPCPHKGGRCA